MRRPNVTVPRAFKGPAVPTGPVWVLPTVSTSPPPHPRQWDAIRTAKCSNPLLTYSLSQVAAVPSEPSSTVGCCRSRRAPRHRSPQVLIRCRRSVLELHHDAPVPTSLTTGATCHSSRLASMSSSTEPPPPSRALSGEPILSDVPQTSSPYHRVALAAVPNPPHRWPVLESGRPCSGRRRFLASVWAACWRRFRGSHPVMC
jgi:hypothetical protein